MFSIKYTNKDDGGTLQSGFTSSEQAEQFIQDTFINDIDGHLDDDILQLVEMVDGEEKVWAEYVKGEFVS